MKEKQRLTERQIKENGGRDQIESRETADETVNSPTNRERACGGGKGK